MQATNKLTDWHFTGDTQCLPLYRYTEDGDAGEQHHPVGPEAINEHYRKEFGEHFQEMAGGDAITAEDIFHYTYAVLHDPVYRHDYRVDLLREFPRLPLYRDFDAWKRMGKELMDLHIGFETAPPYPSEAGGKEPGRRPLRAHSCKSHIERRQGDGASSV